MKIQPMLQVQDVEASSAWYQRVVGLRSGHGGKEYEMLFAGEPFASALLLQLHGWDAHEHGFLGSPDLPVGNGSSLWFEVSDKAAFDAAWARSSGEPVLEAPHWSEKAFHWEYAIQDPDGYVVVVATPFDPKGAPS